MRKRWFAYLIGAGVFSAGMYYAVEPSRDDLVRVQESVRQDFRIEKGIRLANVGFVRKNANELHGFAAFKMGPREIVRACIASRQNSNADFVYTCY